VRQGLSVPVSAVGNLGSHPPSGWSFYSKSKAPSTSTHLPPNLLHLVRARYEKTERDYGHVLGMGEHALRAKLIATAPPSPSARYIAEPSL
jgi:hypothetical protein